MNDWYFDQNMHGYQYLLCFVRFDKEILRYTFLICLTKTAKDFDTAALFSMKFTNWVKVTVDPTSRQSFLIYELKEYTKIFLHFFFIHN